VWGVNYYKYNTHDPTSDMKFAKAVLRFLKRIQGTLEEEEESIVQCLEVFYQVGSRTTKLLNPNT